MQIKQVIPASTAVAAQTSFFTNSAIPAEQILTKLTFRIGGVTLLGGTATENLTPVAAVEIPGITSNGLLISKYVVRVIGTTASVANSGGVAVAVNIRDTSGTPGNINTAAVLSGTAANPSVITPGANVWQQQLLTTAQMLTVAPGQNTRNDNFQIQLSVASGTLTAGVISGDLGLEVYLIGLPLQ